MPVQQGDTQAEVGLSEVQISISVGVGFLSNYAAILAAKFPVCCLAREMPQLTKASSFPAGELGVKPIRQRQAKAVH